MFERSLVFGRVLAGALLCLILVGCGSSVSMSNYEQIQNGMTEVEVESILGEGQEQSSSNVSVPGMSASGKTMMWQDGSKMITVMFMNGEVVSKAQVGL